MKQLICEMCGSNDLVKQDGVFVCQSCGVKYSVEEARKMYVEGKVDVSGSTVFVDKSKEIQNKIAHIESEFNISNYDEVIRLSSDALDLAPQNYKIHIYRAIASCWKSTVDSSKITASVVELQQAIDFMKKQESSESIIIEELEFIFNNLLSLGNALLSLYNNYYESESRRSNAAEREADRLGRMGDAYSYSNPSLAFQYHNQSAALYSKASNIGKQALAFVRTGGEEVISSLTRFAYYVLSVFKFDEKTNKRFWNFLKEYLDGYSDCISLSPKTKQQYDYLVQLCRKYQIN